MFRRSRQGRLRAVEDDEATTQAGDGSARQPPAVRRPLVREAPGTSDAIVARAPDTAGSRPGAARREPRRAGRCRAAGEAPFRPQAHSRLGAVLVLALGAWYGHYWWTDRPLSRLHRRRLCRRQDRDARGQDLRLRRRRRGRGQRPGEGRRRHRAHRRRRLHSSRSRPRATRSPSQQATVERIGKQVAAQQAGVDAGQGAARLRQGRRDPRRARAQAPAGPRRARVSPAGRRSSRRRPTATRPTPPCRRPRRRSTRRRPTSTC